MKKVIYDGSCSLCRVTIDKVKKARGSDELQFFDYMSESVPPGLDEKQLKKEIHVIDEHGTVHRNADGIMEILSVNPRWKWLAVIGRFPLIRIIFRWGYRLIARYRHGHRS